MKNKEVAVSSAYKDILDTELPDFRSWYMGQPPVAYYETRSLVEYECPFCHEHTTNYKDVIPSCSHPKYRMTHPSYMWPQLSAMKEVSPIKYHIGWDRANIYRHDLEMYRKKMEDQMMQAYSIPFQFLEPDEFGGLKSRFFVCSKCDDGMLKLEHIKESKDNYCNCDEGNKLRDCLKKKVKI